MNNQTIYWLWIQKVMGCGSPKIENIVGSFTFAEDFYRAPLDEKKRISGVHPRRYELLEDTDLGYCRHVMDRCYDCGIDIITFGDEAYPEMLRHIPSPPAVLYVRGNMSALRCERNIAVVGTRYPTENGRRIAFNISRDLAKNGVCVVSGGAVGIDTQAHLGALKSNGRTVCVLGCGHEAGYLAKLDEVRNAVATRGAVISEYPPDKQPSKVTFPMRNRIISGLSQGVVVVEAGRRSGSLITVTAALDQGRDVFAVPGAVGSSNSDGTNQLIKDGATPITCADDILGTLTTFKEHRKNEESEYRLDLTEYVETARRIMESSERRAGEAPRQKPEKNAHEQRSVTVSGEKITEKTPKTPLSETNTPAPERVKEAGPKELPELSCEAMAVYRCLRESGELHIDVIAEKTGLPIRTVHSAATELEMEDLIASSGGRLYKAL